MSDAARLQELEDREAIRTVFSDYARYLDGGNYDGYASLFSRDAVWGTATGHAAIAAQVAEYRDRVEGARAEGRFQTAIHLMNNFDITVNGDGAKALVNWSYLVRDPDQLPTIMQTGTYDDELVREDGVWKISRHVINRAMGRGQLETPAPSQHADLARRVQALEDREEIRALFVRAQDCLDGRDLVGYGNCFTEDGEWSGIVGRAVGPAAITAVLEPHCKPWPSEAERTYHICHDFVIELNGDTARAKSQWQHYHRGPNDTLVPMHFGHYDDRLRRTADGWKFERRAAFGDIPYTAPKFQLEGLAKFEEPPLWR